MEFLRVFLKDSITEDPEKSKNDIIPSKPFPVACDKNGSSA
jgi:hypothetical protein